MASPDAGYDSGGVAVDAYGQDVGGETNYYDTAFDQIVANETAAEFERMELEELYNQPDATPGELSMGDEAAAEAIAEPALTVDTPPEAVTVDPEHIAAINEIGRNVLEQIGVESPAPEPDQAEDAEVVEQAEAAEPDTITAESMAAAAPEAPAGTETDEVAEAPAEPADPELATALESINEKLTGQDAAATIATSGLKVYESTPANEGGLEARTVYSGLLAQHGLGLEATSVIESQTMIENQPVTTTVRYAEIAPGVLAVEQSSTAGGQQQNTIAITTALEPYLPPPPEEEEEILSIKEVRDEPAYDMYYSDGGEIPDDIRAALQDKFDNAIWHEDKESHTPFRAVHPEESERPDRYDDKVYEQAKYAVTEVRPPELRPGVEGPR